MVQMEKIMNNEIPPRPDYPFPESIADNESMDKATEYIYAVKARHEMAQSMGWTVSGYYYAGHAQIKFERGIDKAAIDADEINYWLNISDSDGDLLPGYNLDMNNNQLAIEYEGETNDKYFDAVERLIALGGELSERENQPSLRKRAVQFIHRPGISSVSE